MILCGIDNPHSIYSEPEAKITTHRIQGNTKWLLEKRCMPHNVESIVDTITRDTQSLVKAIELQHFRDIHDNTVPQKIVYQELKEMTRCLHFARNKAEEWVTFFRDVDWNENLLIGDHPPIPEALKILGNLTAKIEKYLEASEAFAVV